MKRTIMVILAAIVALGSAGAAEPSLLDEISVRGILRIGTTGDYRPFTWLDKETSTYSGMDVELAQSLARALGVRVEFVATSWPKLAADFQDGKFDVAMGGVSVTLERAKWGVFSSPYLRDGKTPITRCSDAGVYATLPQIDRPGVRVVVNPGGTNERFVRARLHWADLSVFPDNARIFDEIAQGRADVMITDASETRYQAKLRPGVLCAIHPDAPFDFAEKAYWLRRDFALKAFVDQWLHLEMENGEFAAIRAKWLE